MGDKSAIEWTDATWNPLAGCTPVSAGCRNCYAASMALRLEAMGQAKYAGTAKRVSDGRAVFTGRINLDEAALGVPAGWKKHRRIFVNSMSDLFHENVPDEYIGRVWSAMLEAPQHVFQVLTKRPERMAEVVTRLRAEGERKGLRPPYHIWLGTSVEDQAAADARIPHLVRTPAHVRFLSCEPLLGPVDLSRWLRPMVPMVPDAAPATWAEWTWDDWVPAKAREQIESFWADSWRRGPRAWLKNAIEQGSPPYGAQLTYQQPFPYTGQPEPPPPVSGRWLHAWNNMGRLVDGDQVHVAGFPKTHLLDPGPGTAAYQGVQWVIAGGESGPKARPMKAEWARSLRDQCAIAGVPFFFKQLGGVRDKGGDLEGMPEDLRIREVPNR